MKCRMEDEIEAGITLGFIGVGLDRYPILRLYREPEAVIMGIT